MPKNITSYKILSIHWRKDRNCFQLDLEPIGGGRKKFDNKAGALNHAKEMFEVFESGKPAIEIKPWMLEKAVSQYLDNAKKREQDPDDGYGPRSFVVQRCHLRNCLKLSFDGLRLGQEKHR